MIEMSKRIDSLELVERYTKDELYCYVLKIQSLMLKSLRESLDKKGFIEILPVLLSPLTDPLNHDVFEASIDYYGDKFSVTKSMILQKQISVLVTDRIYCVSPNVRLETAEKYSSGRHLIDFVQLDMEVIHASRDEIMSIMEDAIIYTIERVIGEYYDIVKKYHPSLKVPAKGFKKISVRDAVHKYGKDYESLLSREMTEPFWLIDIPLMDREFYDKQNMEDPAVLLDFDLIWPEGFGEGISGGEREHEYEQILKRMDIKGTSKEAYAEYLKLAEAGLLKPSAGCGIGIERFTRYILGLKHVEMARLFAKAPGTYSI